MAGPDCKDCEYVANLRRDLDKITLVIDTCIERIGKLERKTDVEHERTDMLFKILGEIKESIGAIAQKLDALERNPADEYRTIKVAIVTGTIMAFIGAAVSRFF